MAFTIGSSQFWSSTSEEGYIEPKRQYQAIGVIDFVEPFLIQTMTKPSIKLGNTQVKKILKNGSLKVENHYKTGYTLNEISMTIIDAHDAGMHQNLNKAQTLYDMLSDGGYTLRSNDMSPFRQALRFPTAMILELSPGPKDQTLANVSAAKSMIGGAAESLVSGGGLGGVLDAVSSGMEFLTPNVTGVWTLKDPVITNVDFGGGLSYATDDIVKITITMSYNNFKYEKNFI